MRRAQAGTVHAAVCYPNLHRFFRRAIASSIHTCFRIATIPCPVLTLGANFEVSNCCTVVELLIDAASASEHHSRRGVVALTYINSSGERQRAPPHVFQG